MERNTRNWTITLLTSGLCILQYGIPRLSGQLYPATMTTYQVSRSQASFPFILLYTIKYSTGPIVGYLSHKFGPCRIAMAGGIVSSFGITICYFAENVLTICIFWGVFLGFGCGMTTQLVPEILDRNFKFTSSGANGISIAGGSIGTILFSLITEVLISSFCIQGCFLILGALMLHSIPIGMLMEMLDKDSQIEDMSEIVAENKKVSKCANDSFYENLKPANRHKNGLKSKDKVTAVSFIKLDDKVESKTDTIDDPVTTRQEEQNNENEKHARGNTETKLLLIICDAIFILLLMTQCIFAFVNTTIFTVIVDYSRDLGINKTGELTILVVIPILELIGRSLLGFIVDKTCITAMQFTFVGSVCMAFSLASLALAKDTIMVSICVSVFYLFCGGNLAISSGLFSENLEKHKLPMAYASKFFLYVPVSLTHSTLIGYLRTEFESYNVIFYLCSISHVFICLLLCMIPVCAKLNDKRKKPTQLQQTIKI